MTEIESSYRDVRRGPRLIHIIGANGWGDPWRHALDVCRHFRDRGWSVTAYTRDAKVVDSRFRDAGIDVRHCPLRGMFDVYSALQLARDLRREARGTVVHVHRYRDAVAVLLARKLAGRGDIRVVSTRHKLKRGLRHALARRIYRNLDAQIFVSESVRDRFFATWSEGRYPFSVERTHVLIPTVNVGLTEASAEPERGPKVVLYKGVLEPGRGLETLIDAMTQLRGRKTRLWIVGEGDTDYIDTLRRRAQVRDVMDLIDWKLRYGDSGSVIDACHVGVDPALTEVALGPSHIEYMARGRAQVLSSAVSCPDCVGDGVEVLVVPRGDASALGEALLSLVSDDELRAGMGATARASYLDNFSWDECVAKLEGIYCSIINYYS